VVLIYDGDRTQTDHLCGVNETKKTPPIPDKIVDKELAYGPKATKKSTKKRKKD
jgi:hypothetical protein